jgi:predicted RND superfamily exporter protein
MKIEKTLIVILSILLIIAIIGLFKVESKIAMFIPKYNEGLKTFTEAKNKLIPIAEMGRIILDMSMKKGILEAKEEAKKIHMISSSIAKGYNGESGTKFLIKVKYTGDKTLGSIYVKMTFYDKNKKEIDVHTDSLSGINAFQKGEESTGFFIYNQNYPRGGAKPIFDSYKAEIFKVEILP